MISTNTIPQSLFTIVTIFYILGTQFHASLALPSSVQDPRQYLPLSFENLVEDLTKHRNIQPNVATIGRTASGHIDIQKIQFAIAPKITATVDIVNFLNLRKSIHAMSKRDEVAVRLWNWAKKMGDRKDILKRILLDDVTARDNDNDVTMTATGAPLISTTESTVSTTLSMADKVLRSHRSKHGLRIHNW
ncbi:hypothetical protein DdX_14544 [Ditylenchus destructor]|uniref:Uncharacterized protein n=1 Tax=Ditylenchus destructor TaxID=166010 RepID=A0AAD4MRR3_9BILA|nr:hypothetical protein DdX_14544 [Ditylenchus destructor]